MVSEIPEPQYAPPARFEPAVDRSPQEALFAGNYATFWKRLIAALLDGLVLAIAGAVLSTVRSQLPFRNAPIVEVAYSVGFIANGATPGMRAMHIRVVDREGNEPGRRRSMLRYLIPALSWVPGLIFISSPGLLLDMGAPALIVASAALFVLGLLDPLWMIWDPNKQMLHDKVASTFVVYTR